MQACGVEWKLQMPSTSRDIALNRVSHEKTYASYVLRHVGILLEMKGQEYQTVDDAAAALNPATDTGAFLKQHFLWNLLLLEWIKIKSLAPETMQQAVSLRNTTFALTRHAVDWEAATAGHAPAPAERDQGGYLIVPLLVSDSRPMTLLRELLQEMNFAKGSTWTASIDIRKHDANVISTNEKLVFTDALCHPFNVLCNLCMQEKALHVIV